MRLCICVCLFSSGDLCVESLSWWAARREARDRPGWSVLTSDGGDDDEGRRCQLSLFRPSPPPPSPAASLSVSLFSPLHFAGPRASQFPPHVLSSDRVARAPPDAAAAAASFIAHHSSVTTTDTSHTHTRARSLVQSPPPHSNSVVFLHSTLLLHSLSSLLFNIIGLSSPLFPPLNIYPRPPSECLHNGRYCSLPGRTVSWLSFDFLGRLQ